MLLVTVISRETYLYLEQKEQELFNKEVDTAIEAINEHMLTNAILMEGTKAFFENSVEVTPEEWKAYSEAIQIDDPNKTLSSIGYVEDVNQSEIALLIYNTEEIIDKEIIPGYDMNRSVEIRKSLQEARDTGEVSATKSISFQQEGGDISKGFIVFSPIYKSNSTTTTINERKDNIKGYIYAGVEIQNFIQHALNNKAKNINVRIYDSKILGNSGLIAERVLATTEDPEFKSVRQYEEYGHQWNIFFETSPQFTLTPIEEQFYKMVFIGGTLLSLALSAATYLQLTSKEKAENLALKLISQLKTSEQRVRILLENAGDSFILYDSNGRILEINQETSDSLGYQREELLKMKVSDVYKNIGEFFIEVLATKKESTVESIKKSKNGDLTPIEVRLKLFEIDGKKYISALARDISKRKKKEKERREITMQIERMNSLMIGRELKMNELKDEIRQLKDQLAQKEGGSTK